MLSALHRRRVKLAVLARTAPALAALAAVAAPAAVVFLGIELRVLPSPTLSSPVEVITWK